MSEVPRFNPEFSALKKKDHSGVETMSYNDVQKKVVDLVHQLSVLNDELAIARTAQKHAGLPESNESFWKKIKNELTGPIVAPTLERIRVKREQTAQFSEIKDRIHSAIREKITELNQLIAARSPQEQRTLLVSVANLGEVRGLLSPFRPE
jgi:hypothetical protein